MRTTIIRLSLSLLAVWLSGSAPASDALELPSETCNGLFFVPVTFGASGDATLELLVDTGASRTYLDRSALGRVLGHKVPAGRVTLANARIGDLELGSLSAHTLTLRTLSLALGRNVDGILGFPAFKDVLLTLDYPNEAIHVSPGRLPRVDGREIFRYRGLRRPFVDADVGGKSMTVLLDSGATGRFALLPKKSLRWAEAPRPVKTAVGVGYVSLREGGRLADPIRLGPLTFEEPVAMLVGDESYAGWHVLRHFVLTFDQKRKRVRMRAIEPGPIRPAAWVGMGVGIHPRPGGLEVLAVFPGTSAEAEGIRPGDLIVAIDGVPVHETGCPDPRENTVGRRKTLTYRRDGVELRATVTTEVLVP